MRSFTQSAVTSLVVIFGAIGAVPKANAWGAKGHQIVAYVGSEIAAEQNEPFWASNADAMRTLTTVPDRVWKGAKTKADEAPTHWFQADAYVKDIKQCDDILNFPKKYDDAVSKYGEAVIIKNGTAPYRIVQMYKLSVAAFRAGDLTTAVEEAGAMSHYVGDLSQPLHVSENYDGADTGDKGIHAWFETTNIGDEMAIRQEVMKRAEKLMKDPAFIAETKGDLADVINHEIIRSLEQRDAVIQNDLKLGRTSPEAKQTQLNLAEDRMADGAAVLAIVLDRLAQDAGLSQKATAVPVNDPEWIAPEYDSTVRQHTFSTPFHQSTAFDLEDDCGAI
jgi:hypothetical protein